MDLNKIIFYRLPVFLYCIFIFWQSSYASPDALPCFPFSDKIMHFGGYGLLGVLVIRALYRENLNFSRKGLILSAIVFSALYGLSDEIHQSCVSQRSAEALDVAADALGSAAGVLIYSLGKQTFLKKQQSAAGKTKQ